MLVVDPDDGVRNLVAALLKATRNEALLADNVAEGLALASVERPDAIIAVCGLHRVGAEFCRSIRAIPELADTPCILLTTGSALQDYPELFESGCDIIVPIPFRCKQLLVAVDRAMRREQEYAQNRIHVLYQSGETGFVAPPALDRLLAEERLLCFRRRSGVVVIGRDPVRGDRGQDYTGPERRRQAA